ncbi:prephenate dehydrogenase [Anaerolineales bacterium HSG24]|nr:prephenate dehydrogenase [Anaerolineales bacterium HSG24]
MVGLGLMGGSLALVLKQQHLCRRIVCLVRREDAAREAKTLNVVDEAMTDPAQALGQADIVVFATPVRVLLRQLSEYAPFYKPGAIITDMGSTKQEIITVMNALPPEFHPIGSHPMCGKEISGLNAADATLYQNAPWILTPLDRTPFTAIQIIHQLAVAIGAKPRQISADRHDKLVATISHMPYTLSATLVLAAQSIAEQDSAVWDIAASGFRDMSRIAASDVGMMLDILLTNRTAVLETLTEMDKQLATFTQAIDEMDEDKLYELMHQAAKQRQSLYT